MDIVNINSSLGNYNNSSKNPNTVVNKALNQLEQQSQKSVSLVQKSAPDVGRENGKLVNLYA